MRFEVSRRVDADPAAVWAALTDVEQWPKWTSSMTSVRLLGEGPLRAGSRAVVKQPGLLAQVWQVTEFTEGREFTWVARGPGVTTTGSHVLVPEGDGAVTVLLGLEQRGPFGAVIGLLLGTVTRRYLTMEAEGLKRAAEDAPY
ncbi:SRPBCC family protein [Amycolatopsis aidingensis]|uniref:SRPBCC family protein n=1 Tax=Amycolatopsis aidingensis TaxID=2842453 RepID=UPI001C0D27C7|nr:SRPBCC family protein [Amycolatopsis aidingensis]